MKRLVLISAVGLVLFVSPAQAQLRRPALPAPIRPGYIDTSWQNNPYVYWQIHHPYPPPWPQPWPQPWPRPYPYPYPVPVPVPYAVNPYTPAPVQPTPPAPGPTDIMPTPRDNTATVRVLLPSSAADVWVDGHKMADALNTTRVFISPTLEPGHDYTYTIRARWPQRGAMVTAERQVRVSANRTAVVDFTQAGH